MRDILKENNGTKVAKKTTLFKEETEARSFEKDFHEEEISPLSKTVEKKTVKKFDGKLVEEKKPEAPVFKAAEKQQLVNACIGNDAAAIKKILDEHPDLLNAPLNNKGHTALHIAAKFNRTDALNILTEYRDLNYKVKDKYGRTPLQIAEEKLQVQDIDNQTAIVEDLVELQSLGGDNKKIAEMQTISKKLEKSRNSPVRMDNIKHNENTKDILTRKESAATTVKPVTASRVIAQNPTQTAVHHAPAAKPAAATTHNPAQTVAYQDPAKAPAQKPQANNSSSFEKELEAAAKEGNQAKIISLLQNKPAHIAINQLTIKGVPLFYAAALSNHAKIVEFLLKDPSIDPNKCALTGKVADVSPLAAAAAVGSADAVKVLLKDPRVNVNQLTKEGISALHFACNNGRIDVVELLMKDNRLDINPQHFKQHHSLLLYYACKTGNVKVVGQLLQNPALDVNKIHNTASPLCIAICEGKTEVVKMLLKNEKLDINERGPSGSHHTVPMKIACQNGRLEIVKLLLADPRLDAKQLPEMAKLAFESGKPDIVKAILKHEKFPEDSKLLSPLKNHKGFQEWAGKELNKNNISGDEREGLLKAKEDTPAKIASHHKTTGMALKCA
jgi:ankyrin repeat protein